MSDQSQTVSSAQSSSTPSGEGGTPSQPQAQPIAASSVVPTPVSVSPQVPSATSPIGYGHKEHGGFSTGEPTTLLKASEGEPVLPNEVKEVGVETQTDFAALPEESTGMGMQLAKESVPVMTEPTGAVTFPLSVATAKNVVKVHRKLTDSIYWLAMLIIRQVQAGENRK